MRKYFKVISLTLISLQAFCGTGFAQEKLKQSQIDPAKFYKCYAKAISNDYCGGKNPEAFKICVDRFMEQCLSKP